MIEIFQIFILFFIFSLLCFVPLNISGSKKFNKKKFSILDISTFNLIINLNLLLVLSFLPISLNVMNLILIFIYFSFFIYKYLIQNKEFKFIINFFKFKVIFFIIFFIISINVAATLDLGWDAKYFYYIKSLFYIQGQNFADLQTFKLNVFHPHLGSFLWAFFSNILPLKFEYFGRLLFVYLFLFSIFYVCHNNSNNNLKSNLIFIFIITISYAYGRFSGLQEILIFSTLAILSKYYYYLRNSQNMVYILFIILGCNLLLWFKAEGLVYASILIVLMNLNNKISYSTKIRINLFFVTLFLFKVFIDYIFNMNIDGINGQPFYSLDYILDLDLVIVFYKLKILLSYLAYYVINNFFFIAGFIILLSLNAKLKFDNYLKIINYYFVLTLLFILVAYIFRDFEIEYFVRTTLERIVFITSGFYVFIVINFLNSFKRN